MNVTSDNVNGSDQTVIAPVDSIAHHVQKRRRVLRTNPISTAPNPFAPPASGKTNSSQRILPTVAANTISVAAHSQSPCNNINNNNTNNHKSDTPDSEDNDIDSKAEIVETAEAVDAVHSNIIHAYSNSSNSVISVDPSGDTLSQLSSGQDIRPVLQFFCFVET